MKKIFYSLIAGSIVFASCERENIAAEFDPKTVDSPSVEISERTIAPSEADNPGDVELIFNVSTQSTGALYYSVLTEKFGEPLNVDIINGDVTGAIANSKVELKEDSKSGTSGPLPAASKYYIYSVMRTTMDEVSPVAIDSIDVNDITGPVLISSVPENNGTADVAPGNITLVFNEDVVVTTSAVLTLTSYFSGQTYSFSSDKFSASGNEVTVDMGDMVLDYDDILLVSLPKGALLDLSENESTEVEWNFEGGEFTRLDYYFRVRGISTVEIMSNFTGLNTVNLSRDGALIDTYSENLIINEGSSNVLSGVGFFAYHTLNYEFDIESMENGVGGVKMERFETEIYLDIEAGSFYLGEPSGNTQFRIFYVPVLVKGEYAGEFDVNQNNFYVAYDLVASGYGTLWSILVDYKKDVANLSVTVPGLQSSPDREKDISGYKIKF